MAWKETYKTSSGTKRYRVVSRDDKGKKHSKSFSLSKDADAYMLDAQRKEQLGHLWEDDPVTFGEFAGIEVREGKVTLTGDGWFERYRPTVRPSTWHARKSVLTHLGEIASVRIDKITPGFIEDICLTLQVRNPATAKRVHETVKMILRSAKVRGQKVNPAVLELHPPSYEPGRRRVALSLEDIERLAEESDEPHLIRVAAYSGLRKGELFALRDEDLDLKAGTLSVTGSVYDGKRYDRAKTRSGIRVVPLPKQAVAELKLQLMRRTGTAGIVFPASEGGYWWASNFNKEFVKWREATKLDITFHDLRHTYASLMVKAEVHPKVLQQAMGHANFNITMDLYTHLSDEQAIDGAKSLESLISGASSPIAAPSRTANDLSKP